MLFCGLMWRRRLDIRNPRTPLTATVKCALKRGIPHPQSPDKTIECFSSPKVTSTASPPSPELPGADKFESWILMMSSLLSVSTGAYMTSDIIDKMITSQVW